MKTLEALFSKRRYAHRARKGAGFISHGFPRSGPESLGLLFQIASNLKLGVRIEQR
jgi:hypothetical protein